MIYRLGFLTLTRYSLLSSYCLLPRSLLFSSSTRHSMSEKKKVCVVGSGNWYLPLLSGLLVMLDLLKL